MNDWPFSLWLLRHCANLLFCQIFPEKCKERLQDSWPRSHLGVLETLAFWTVKWPLCQPRQFHLNKRTCWISKNNKYQMKCEVEWGQKSSRAFLWQVKGDWKICVQKLYITTLKLIVEVLEHNRIPRVSPPQFSVIKVSWSTSGLHFLPVRTFPWPATLVKDSVLQGMIHPTYIVSQITARFIIWSHNNVDWEDEGDTDHGVIC